MAQETLAIKQQENIRNTVVLGSTTKHIPAEFDTEERKVEVLKTLSPLFQCFMASDARSDKVFDDFEQVVSAILTSQSPHEDHEEWSDSDDDFFSLHNTKWRWTDEQWEKEMAAESGLAESSGLLVASSSSGDLRATTSGAASSSAGGQGQLTRTKSTTISFRPMARRDNLPRKVELNDSTLKQGALTKLGKVKKNWQRRHFMLTPHNLYYFKTATDVRPVGVIPLDESVTIRIDEEMVTKNFCFQIGTKARTFFLYADNKKDMDSWLDILNQRIASLRAGEAADTAKPAPSQSATKQGFLTKQGLLVKNWKRRWFLLQNHVLYYFSSPLTDQQANQAKAISKAAGSIPLDEFCDVKPAPDCPKPFAFQISTRDRTYYAYADDSEQLDEWISAIRQSIVNYRAEK